MNSNRNNDENKKISFKEIVFNIIVLFNILIWAYVLFAFLFGKKYAKFNLYFFIPFIYILHILPFHVLVRLKNNMYGQELAEEKENKINDLLIIPTYFIKLQEIMEKKTTFSPISPQGMLIFGLISSLIRIYPGPFKKCLKKAGLYR